MSLPRSVRLSLGCLACWLLCASFVSAQATATKPKAAKPKAAKPKYVQFTPAADLFESERAQRDYYAKQVVAVLRGRLPWGDQAKAVIDKWFLKKVLLEFTQAQNWSKLPELRASLLKEAKSASSRQAATFLKERLLMAMTRFSAPKLGLHPAVRYNAMLLIGDLNDMEAGSRDAQGNRVMAADPMDKAFNVLMTEFKSTPMDAMRVAAQVGILRHAKLDQVRPPARRLDSARRSATVTTMLELVNSSPPAGRSVAGHTWMQRRGIEIIAALGAVGAVPQVHPTLESIVADDTKPMSLRCTAAEALSRWRPDVPTKFDAQTLSASLGRLGGQALINELEFIGKLQEREKLKQQIRDLIADTSTAMTVSAAGPSGGGGAAGGGMAGMAEMMEQQRGQPGEEDDEGDQEDAALAMQQFFGGGGAGMTGGDPLLDSGPEDPLVTRSRRRLKHQLACARAGLLGIQNAQTTEAQQASIKRVLDAIEIAYATDPVGGDLPALEESIKKGLGALAFLMPEATADDETALMDPSAAGEPPALDPTAAAPAAPAKLGAPDPAAPADPSVAAQDLSAEPNAPAAAEPVEAGDPGALQPEAPGPAGPAEAGGPAPAPEN